MKCDHDLEERESSVYADGYCPICMAAEIERLTKERDLALANADAVYAKLMPEIERLRAALTEIVGMFRVLEVARNVLLPYQQYGGQDGGKS